MLFTLLGQLRGVGVLSPIYYFLYYCFTPIEKFKASDMRLGRRNYAVVLLPAMVLTYYIPLFAMLEWPNLPGRQSWLFVWQMFPIWVSLASWFLSGFIFDTTSSDRFSPNRDLAIIRYTIGSLAGLSSGVWLWTLVNAATYDNVLGFFVPQSLPIHTNNYVDFAREFLKIDQISLFGNTFLWLAYLFWDMKHAGMVRTSWFSLTIYLLSSLLVLGPGATAGLGWLWRENVLATTRHKDALTEATAAKHDARHQGKEAE
jgi:hypothetical protein